MDKFEFLEVITDIFSELKTSEEIEHISSEMIRLITSQKELSKEYLRLGIL